MPDIPNTTITPAAEPPVQSTTKSAAQPISMEQLKAEISHKPITESAPQPNPVEPKDRSELEKTTPNSPMSGLKQSLRDTLTKSKEEKPKPAEKKAEPVKEVVKDSKPEENKPAEDDVPADQLQVLPHDKPDTAKRIKKLLSESSRLKAELAEAKKAPQTPANTEEVTRLKEEAAKIAQEKAELEKETRRYRRVLEVENDPEFKKKYDEPREKAETTIESTLKNYNFGEGTLKAIKDEGGFAAFSRSNKTFSVTEKDSDGQPQQVQRTARELANSWLSALPLADAELIRGSVQRQQLLSEERKAEAQKAREEAEAHFAQQKESLTKAQQAEQAKNAELAKRFQERVEEAKKADWLQDKPVPENASEDEKKRIKDYNEFNEQLRGRLTKSPANADEYADIVMEAAQYHHLRREAGSKDERIKALEAELERAKKGTRTTSKGGSLLVTGGHKPEGDESKLDPTDWKSRVRNKVVSRGDEE